MNEPDLFSLGYPHAPAYRATDTSFAAAASVDAKTLQRLVLAELNKAPLTADEIADRLNVDKLSIRPRCSELRRLGKVEDSKQRRQNGSGKSAIVWRVAA